MLFTATHKQYRTKFQFSTFQEFCNKIRYSCDGLNSFWIEAEENCFDNHIDVIFFNHFDIGNTNSEQLKDYFTVIDSMSEKEKEIAFIRIYDEGVDSIINIKNGTKYQYYSVDSLKKLQQALVKDGVYDQEPSEDKLIEDGWDITKHDDLIKFYYRPI